MTTGEGYCDCACRDCFEIAIGKAGEAMCHACESSGCEVAIGECEAPHTYCPGDDRYSSDGDACAVCGLEW